MAKVEKVINVSEIIRRRKYNASIRHGYLSLLIRTILLAIMIWFALSQVLLLTQAQGMNMFPSIKDGDLIIAYRLQKNYIKDDVVVYQTDAAREIGRIVACENDIVTIDDTGILMVNGTPQTGEILFPTYANENITYPYQVPENSVFILGDYRTESQDSRNSGAVNMDKLIGKVITLIRRRGL